MFCSTFCNALINSIALELGIVLLTVPTAPYFLDLTPLARYTRRLFEAGV